MTENSHKLDVSIVFTNWNTRDFMRDCINSVVEKTQGLTYEIIVVDDGSTDGSVEMLQTEFPDVKIVINEKNLGVAKAYNRGVAQARGIYIQMLNTDMILINNAIKILYDFLENHPEAGACGGWLCNRDLSSQVSYGNFPSFSQAFIDALFLNDLFPRADLPNRGAIPQETVKAPFETEYLTGASMLIRKGVIDEMGFFDETFTSYCEETDFCYRMKHHKKLKLYFVPAAQIIHFGGASFSNVRKYQIQLLYSGYNKFLTKHHGFMYSVFTRLLYCFPYFVKMIFHFVQYLIFSDNNKEQKKTKLLNSWYNVRYSILTNETFTGK
ncbi:MAG: glycosyltransferase family 2 protein [Bacteroidota bacterium]|nr:glycosyltransferase family 2 protein [Bacteroidota bacterium]